MTITTPANKAIYTYDTVPSSSVTRFATVGPSGAFYLLEETDGDDLVAKIESDGTVTWVLKIRAVYAVSFVSKALVLTSDESKVYVLSGTDPSRILGIWDGTVKHGMYGAIVGTDEYLQMHIASDDSYLYFPAKWTDDTPQGAFCQLDIPSAYSAVE